jgi:hypothetical protein
MLGPLVGRGFTTLIPYIGDPTNAANAGPVTQYIRDMTGLSLDIGRTLRINQALTNSAQYLIDKQVLLKAILEGSNGNGGAAVAGPPAIFGSAGHSSLHVALPGSGGIDIPLMTPLFTEYANKYEALIRQGIPDEIAKRQTEDFVKTLLNDRIASFTPAFPGLTERGNELTPLFQKTINDAQFNVLASGAAGSDVSNAPMENVQDVLPKYQKRKEKKRTKRKKYKQYYRENKKK